MPDVYHIVGVADTSNFLMHRALTVHWDARTARVVVRSSALNVMMSHIWVRQWVVVAWGVVPGVYHATCRPIDATSAVPIWRWTSRTSVWHRVDCHHALYLMLVWVIMYAADVMPVVLAANPYHRTVSHVPIKHTTWVTSWVLICATRVRLHVGLAHHLVVVWVVIHLTICRMADALNAMQVARHVHLAHSWAVSHAMASLN